MVEILNQEFKLNDVVVVGYLNERGNYEIVSGRIYNWSDRTVNLDVSYDLTSLEDTVRVRLNKVKYVKKTMNNMWR